MKPPAISDSVITLLSQHKISVSDILCFSPIDMNTECEYCDGYVVLTNQVLAIVTAPPKPEEIHDFKGYASKDKVIKKMNQVWSIRTYELDSMNDLFMEGSIACNLLILKNQNDECYELCAFSNLHKKKIHTILRTYANLKNPEPGWSPALEEEEEEYCPVCGTMYPDKDRHICPKCMDKKSIFLRVLSYFKPYRLRLVLMLFCFIGTALLNLLWPYLVGNIFIGKILAKDEQFLSQLPSSIGTFTKALLLLLAVFFLTKLSLLLLQMLQGVFTAQIVSSVVRDLKKDIFRKMGKLSINFFKNRQTGSLMTRVLSDAERVTGFFIDGAPYIFVYGFTYIATIVTMFSLEWRLAIITLVTLPVAFFISLALRPHLWTLYGKRHRAERNVNSKVNDNLSGARVVKAFGQQEKEMEHFGQTNNAMKDSELSVVRFSSFFHAMFGSAQEITTFIIWCVGIVLILGTNSITFGLFYTFVSYIGQLSGPMNFFARIFQWWADSINSAQRMFEIMDSIPDVVEDANPVSLPDMNGDIELSHVSFGYEPNKPVLKDIYLHIKPGQMIGIVGRSGAGKTTLINLISRMYDTQEGTITIDGIDVKKLSFHDLRKNVAVVSQETYIFMGTVEQNIAYASPNASKSDIIRAAILANAHDFILRMPDGYDTIIGSSGRELSGGERQRISIARAILSNPKILILDEATASVDTETERAIQRSINYLIQGRTTLSIAHRLSTLRDADSLVVIDNGRITERGTKKELMEKKGTYYKLMELQTKALALQMFQEGMEASSMKDNTFQLESMEKETEEMLQMRYLTPGNCTFEHTKGGFLKLTLEDCSYDRVWVIRMFPFTNPNDYISIRSTDEHSREIGIIEHLNEFDSDTQAMLVEQLNIRYFTPVITKIKDIKTEYGYAYFDVITDHGECRFTINMGSNSVSHLSENRLLISDLDDNRFEIQDIMKLTPKERKKLDLFI